MIKIELMALTIILLVIFGILLILLEFLVVPGVTIAGIGGFALMIAGVYLAYDYYGTPIGHYYFAGLIVLSIVMIYFALSSSTWKRISLKASITSKTNVHDDEIYKVGDTGKTISRLAPMGKVEVNGHFIEGKSTGSFIDENTEIEVVKILRNKLIVKPINK